MTSATPWDEADGGVLTGPRPPGVSTLADLARAMDLVRPPLGRRPTPQWRSARLLPLHSTVALLDAVILSPWAARRHLVVVEPDQLGWLAAGPPDLWVGRHLLSPADSDTAPMGQQVVRLLDPMIAAVAPAAGVTVRAARLVAYDALLASGLRLERAAADGRPPGWTQRLMLDCGHVPRHPGRLLHVRPDGGPPLVLPAPRTCCVLAARAPDDACPTCPLHPDDTDRIARTEQWLSGLPDDAFAEVVGRPRRDCPPRP